MGQLRERRRKERMEKTKKKIWYWSVLGLAVLIIIGCVAYLLGYRWELMQKEDTYENLRSTEQQEATEQVIPVEDTEKLPEVITCEAVYDFNELQESNRDIYAWITIPGTLVDYPVLQSEEDNYYLDRNLDHSTGYPGCIYTNACNAKDFSDYNTVLYGHNMKNDSMFGSLHDFETEEAFLENREIIVYTKEKRLTYEVYAAVKFSDAYIPANYDVTTSEGNNAYLAALQEWAKDSSVSRIMEDMEVTSEDQLITLSTCVAGEGNRRYLVVGCLVEEAFYDEAIGLEALREDDTELLSDTETE